MTDREQYMRRALALARMGEGRVSPNPMVGCGRRPARARTST